MSASQDDSQVSDGSDWVEDSQPSQETPPKKGEFEDDLKPSPSDNNQLSVTDPEDLAAFVEMLQALMNCMGSEEFLSDNELIPDGRKYIYKLEDFEEYVANALLFTLLGFHKYRIEPTDTPPVFKTFMKKNNFQKMSDVGKTQLFAVSLGSQLIHFYGSCMYDGRLVFFNGYGKDSFKILTRSKLKAVLNQLNDGNINKLYRDCQIRTKRIGKEKLYGGRTCKKRSLQINNNHTHKRIFGGDRIRKRKRNFIIDTLLSYNAPINAGLQRTYSQAQCQIIAFLIAIKGLDFFYNSDSGLEIVWADLDEEKTNKNSFKYINNMYICMKLLQQYFEDHEKSFDMTQYLKRTQFAGQAISMGQLTKHILEQKELYALIIYWYFNTERDMVNFVLEEDLVAPHYSNNLPWLNNTIIETLKNDGYTDDEAKEAAKTLLNGIIEKQKLANGRSPYESTRGFKRSPKKRTRKK